MKERFYKFSFSLIQITRYWHKLASGEMEKYGLKGMHCVYLLALLQSPEGLTSPKLCELCGKDKSDVSRMMSIMEKKGLVVKEGKHHNLYGGVFKLTESGIKAAHEVQKRADLVVGLAGKELTDEKREVFYEALDLITANLKKISAEGLPN